MHRILFLVLLFLVSINGITQTHYYVAPTGDNANSGLSTASPKLTIQHAVAVATDGDFIHLANGTYTLTTTLTFDKALTIIGESEAGTIINATRTSNSAWAINPNRSNTSLSNFTLLPNANTGGYPIHVSANSGPPLPVISNINLSHITINGAKKTAFDFNGVSNLSLTYITATNSSAGNGIQLSGCTNVTASNITTSGNAWGGLAIYVSKAYPSGVGRGSNGIVIDATNSVFAEEQGIYNQDEAGLTNTDLTVTGYNYLVKNSAADPYTYYLKDKTRATTFATATLSAATSFIRQLSGGAYLVCPGLKIQAAINAATANATVNIDPGTYHEDVAIDKTMVLKGAGMNVTTLSGITGGGSATIQVGAGNVVIDGLSITRDGNNIATWNDALNTAGIAIQTAGDLEVKNCKLTGNRTAIDINNSDGNNIHNNIITSNRSGLIFRNKTDGTTVVENLITNNWTIGVLFLDASGGANSPVQSAANSHFNSNVISGNWYGQIVDRQTGGSLPTVGNNLKNFGCNWLGSIAPVLSVNNTTEPGYGDQVPVAYGGTAVAPPPQPDIAGAGSGNFIYQPYLINNTDTDEATNGFQPSRNSCRVPPNANLSLLVVDHGTMSPSYTPTTASYTVPVGNLSATITVTPTAEAAGTTITVNGTVVGSGTASTPVALAVGSNTITVVSIADDGVVSKTYTIRVIRAVSSNANLSSLEPINGVLNPAFAAGTPSYSAVVSNGTLTASVIATAADLSSTILVNGITVTSGTASAALSLNAGLNIFTIVVNAADRVTSRTYQYSVTRLPSSHAALTSLVINSGTLSPAFSATTVSYTVSVPFGTTTVTVTPVVSEATSTVSVNGITVTSGTASGIVSLNTGSNTINVLVTAEDGVTSTLYKITVSRLPNSHAALTSLVINSGALSPAFAAATVSYTVTVPFGTTTVTVTPVVSETTSTVSVNGITVTSGTASGIVSLNTGSNTINVLVTAEDGVTSTLYKITVNRAAGNNANLSALRLSTGVLSPSFSEGTLNYTSVVLNGTPTVTLIPTVSDITSAVTINAITVTSGSASGPIILAAGPNIINVNVRAVDGITMKTYQVIVVREPGPSTNTDLLSITMSNGTLSPVFTSTTANYTLSIPETVNTLALTATAVEALAAIKVNGITVASGAALQDLNVTADITTFTISVTAADGVTKHAYTITAIKPRSSWTGTINVSWNNPGNWTNGVPDRTKSAVITNANTLPAITGKESVNNLTIQAGAGISIAGGLQVVGNAVNNGIISGTGAITFSGATAQTLNGAGTISNLTVNNPKGLSIAPGAGNTQSLTGLLTISNGLLNTGDNLTLVSTADLTAGVAILPAGASIEGRVTAQRWIAGQRGFRTMGHPFNEPLPLNQLMDNFAITGPGSDFTSGLGFSSASALYYDSVSTTPLLFQKPLSIAPNTASTPLWTVARGIMAMVRGKGNEGLSAYPSNDQPTAFAADVRGTLNQGSLTDYVLGTNAANTSYNLVGNPYAAPINIRLLKSNGGALLSANNGTSGVSNTIYVYNPFKNAGISSTPNQEMRGGMDAYTNDGSTDIIIPSFGAFFVHAKGAGNVIRFDESIKAADKTPVAVMGVGTTTAKLTLEIENKRGTWDYIKLRWDHKAGSAGTDAYDGPKLNNELLDFYSISSDKTNLCIDSRSDSFNHEEVIPLGIKTQVQDATFRIKVAAYAMPSNVRVYLVDKLQGTETLLEKINDSYVFALTSDEASKGDHRFEVAISTAKIAAPNMEAAAAKGIRIVPNPFKDELIILLGRDAVSTTGTTKLRLMNIEGRVVKTAVAAPGTSVIKVKTGSLATGAYFVEVFNDAGRIVRQVIKN
jgi:hypothetical protein